MDENARVRALLDAHKGIATTDTITVLLETVTASHALLEKLDNMTTEEFSKGADKAERERLAEVTVFEDDVMPYTEPSRRETISRAGPQHDDESAEDYARRS